MFTKQQRGCRLAVHTFLKKSFPEIMRKFEIFKNESVSFPHCGKMKRAAVVVILCTCFYWYSSHATLQWPVYIDAYFSVCELREGHYDINYIPQKSQSWNHIACSCLIAYIEWMKKRRKTTLHCGPQEERHFSRPPYYTPYTRLMGSLPMTFSPKSMLNWEWNWDLVLLSPLAAQTTQCVLTAVTDSSSFVEFALNALPAFTLLPKVIVPHSILIMEIPWVKGPIKYTWVFLQPKDSQLPLPSHLLKDKRLWVSKELNFVLK